MDKVRPRARELFSAEETCEWLPGPWRRRWSRPLGRGDTAAPSLADLSSSRPRTILGRAFSLRTGAAEAASAELCPRNRPAPSPGAGASVAWWPASACVSEASVAWAVASVVSALWTCWLACWTAEGAVLDDTRMLDEPA